MTRLRWLVLALVLALVAAACADDDDDDTSDTSEATSTVAEAADDSTTTTAAPDADGGTDGATTTTAAPEGDASGVVIDPESGRMVPAECAAGENTADPSIGVTESTVDIGMLGIDYGPLASIGFAASGLDIRESFQAFVDDLNANGGICGRTINYNGVLYDIIRREGGLGCIQVTEDTTNLAVLVQGGTPEAVCVAQAGPVTYSQHDFSEAAITGVVDNMYISFPSWDEQIRATTQWAIDSGQLDGKVVGVWYGWVFTDLGDAVEEIVLPMLDEAGIEHIDFRTDFLGPSDPQGNAVLLTAATEFAARPIDVLMNYTGSTNHTGIQLELANQGLIPEFISAPVSNNASNEIFAASGGVQEISDGERIVSFSYAPNEVVEGLRPASDSCNAYAESLGLEAQEPGTFDYSTIANQCLQFDLVVAALSLAGPNLTRESFAAALEALPPHPTARGYGLEDFSGGPGFSSTAEYAVHTYDGTANLYTTDPDSFFELG